MAEFSNLSHFQEENSKALFERQQSLLTWEKYKKDYENLEEILTTLPNRTSHEAMVPLGAVAFMPGKLVHTNEIMVLLGDNWFAERSAAQALGIVERRKKYLETNIAGINEELKGFESRMKFTADIQAAAEESSEMREIKEELSPLELERIANRSSRKAHTKARTAGGSRKVEGSKSTTRNIVTKEQKQPQDIHVSAEDLSLFARLDKLEEEEEENAELDDETCKKDTANLKKEEVRWSAKRENKQSKIGKKVTWKDDCGKNDDLCGFIASEDDDDDEEGGNTICVRFTSSAASGQAKMPPKSSQHSALVSPSDIYSHFTCKQELKTILKKHPVEEKKIQTTLDKEVLDTQQRNDVARKIDEKDFNSQKAFSGTVVERQASQSEQHSSDVSQISPSQPGKKASRFKASRQKLP